MAAKAMPPRFDYSMGNLPGAAGQATGVSCPPQGACIAVDQSGEIFELSGAHALRLGATAHGLSGFGLFSVSCPTRTFCVAGSDNAVLRFSPTGVFEYPLSFSADSRVHWQSMSCSSPSFCMAGGGITGGPQNGAGVVASWNGVAWSRVRVVLPDIPTWNLTQISSMSCTSPSFCLAADQNERTLRWNGKAWLTRHLKDDTGHIESFTFACASEASCLALGSYGSGLLSWNGKAWQPIPSPRLTQDGFGLVACISTVECAAADEIGHAAWSSGQWWSVTKTIDPDNTDFIQGLSCSRAGFCEAVTSKDHFFYLYDPKHPPTSVPCSLSGCEGTRV